MPATTSEFGFPFLELEDPPDIAGGLQSLAEAVEAEIVRVDADAAGGSWHTLSLDAGIGVQAGVTPAYRLIGGQVFLRGLIKKASGSWAAGTVYDVTGTAIPSGFRPVQAVYRQAAAHTADASSRVIVNSTGVVQMSTGASPPTYLDLSSVSWLLS